MANYSKDCCPMRLLFRTPHSAFRIRPMFLKPLIRVIMTAITLSLFAACERGDEAPALILPDHPHIQYTGRIDFSDPRAPVLFWPGTSIVSRFEGTSLKVQLSDSGESFYNVFIDGNEAAPLVLDCQPGMQVYELAGGLEDGIHTVQLFRRTEDSTGPTVFGGWILDPGKKLTSPPPRPERRIEFIGNSITCGMGNECVPGEDNSDLSKENNYLAYGAITARNLGAEYHCIAKSGIGIMISWFDLIMPDFYDRLNPANPASKWDFSRWQPQVVVINLFQNDSWLQDRLDPRPTPEEIIAHYRDFLGRVRGKYPEAHIFCTLGSMDATREGQPWPGYVQSTADRFRAEHNDGRIYTHFFAYDQQPRHPDLAQHRRMAEELTGVIREKVGW